MEGAPGHRALAIYAACGARWDLARVRHRVRQLGIQRRLPTERRPTLGWRALTESELAVVRLVADGLTNREVAERLYVSPHTVNGHLRHAFEKLAINSRVALTRIAADHPEPVQRIGSSAGEPPTRPGEGAKH
jgi:DNA-binding CsgD family transcriptional regulator